MRENDLHHNEAARIDGGVRENGETKKNTKARITIHLDRDVVSYFKNRAAERAKGYQTLINDALREYTRLGSPPHVITDLVERVKRLEAKLLEGPSR